jgi:ATP-dependent helicase/nuclease subunit A
MKNIELINASAGSGKTFNLTRIIVEALKSGIKPEELMATTFTNKAADELRERIRVELLKNKQVEEAGHIYDGFIGTVNSICARLLREYALDAGLSPAIDVMPENDGDRIFNIAIDSAIVGYARSMEASARRLALDGRGTRFSKNDWRNHVKQIADLARSNLILPDTLKECAAKSWESIQALFDTPTKNDLNKELMDAITLAVNHLESINITTKKTRNVLEDLKNAKERFDKGYYTWSDWVRLSKLDPGKGERDIVEPVIAVADKILCHPQFQADVRQIIEGSFQCAIGALEGYETFKREHGLMDFIDQETRVLDLCRNNAAFKTSMGDRIQLVMVDEFQDTSPIQLALFLALNELAGHSVWVGDPKQAIYGFRGTDPQLMEEVVALLDASGILEYSWRSREKLLDFTNALFSQVFYAMGTDKVKLKIPPERAEVAKGGSLEAWYLTVKNNSEEAAAIANGVRTLIEENPDINPGDIAILCRTNARCRDIATALENLGVRASVGKGSLLDVKECQLAIAALRYMNNPLDTVALAELMLMQCSNDPGNWLTELMSDSAQTKQQWHASPIAKRLNEGRSQVPYWTPLEALEQAIDRIDLLLYIKSRPNPGLAITNLDALRGACREYIELCRAHRNAATIEGYIAYLYSMAPEQAEGTGEKTVNILTYHGAKGLEWPWVVLTGLEQEPRYDVFGVHIEAARQFDPTNPLADRKIRYWPWFFGSQKTYARLDERIDGLPYKSEIQAMSEREEQRLLYVGMTRAKDGLVLAIRKQGNKLKTAWLDVLKAADGKSIIKWDADADNKMLQVGDSRITIDVKEYNADDIDLPGLAADEEQYVPYWHPVSTDYPPARISPSSLSGNTGSVGFDILYDYSTRINIKGHPDMNALGSAIHAYLALDYSQMSEVERLETAQEILKSWKIENALEPKELLLAGQNLHDFINQHYPGSKVLKEWPIFLRNAQNQIMQGWVDVLLETADGYVIIDHKSYPGTDNEERVKEYAPQLMAYKEAVEKATGKPVIGLLLHLPVRGLILKIHC